MSWHQLSTIHFGFCHDCIHNKNNATNNGTALIFVRSVMQKENGTIKQSDKLTKCTIKIQSALKLKELLCACFIRFSCCRHQNKNRMNDKNVVIIAVLWAQHYIVHEKISRNISKRLMERKKKRQRVRNCVVYGNFGD